jgi:hypothetical protein
MHCHILLRQTFLPLDSVRLGRLVLNVSEPEQDYFDPFGDEVAKHSVGIQTNYVALQPTTGSKDLLSILTRLVSTSISKHNRMYVQITADTAKKYVLQNSNAWFKRALGSEAARGWLELAICQGDEVYMVVGYTTLLDSRVIEGTAAAMGPGEQLILPAPPPLPEGSDPTAIRRQFVSPGEQICAVQYRKVRFKWLSTHDLDSAELSRDGIRWGLNWNIRGQEVDTLDIVEADLQDELELKGDYEKHTSDKEGDFLVDTDN